MPDINPTCWSFIENTIGFMCLEELRWIGDYARDADSYVEVGVFNGRSTLPAGLAMNPEGTLILVDISFGQEFWKAHYFLRVWRPQLRIVMMERSSAEAVVYTPPVDKVFIDACHDYEAVHLDIENWSKKCRELAGHDYDPPAWPGVVRAVDELLPNAIKGPVFIWRNQCQ